jgi:hypothetical protein
MDAGPGGRLPMPAGHAHRHTPSAIGNAPVRPVLTAFG